MFPTPHTVSVRTHNPGATNSTNDPINDWGEPQEEDVYGWGPSGSSEANEPGRDAVTWDLDLLVPPGFTCGPRDRIIVPGYSEEFEVEGVIQDFNHGPFGFQPGSLVRLRAVRG